MPTQLRKNAAKLVCRSGKAELHTDSETKGLQLKLFPDGGRSWWWQYRWGDKTGRLLIGPFGSGEHAFDYARAKQVADGWNYAKNVEKRDPTTYVYNPKAARTLRDVINATLARSDLKASSKRSVGETTKRLLEEFGDTPMPDFTAKVFLRFLEANYRDAPGMARTMIANVRAAINHAKAPHTAILPRDYVNPASNLVRDVKWLQKPRGRSRGHSRALTEVQMAAVFAAIREVKENYNPRAPKRPDGITNIHPLGAMLVEFCLVTGCRPGEAQTLKWSELDVARTRVIKVEHKTDTATNSDRVIILTDVARAILAEAEAWRAKLKYTGEYVFVSVNRKKAKAEHISHGEHYARQVGLLAGLSVDIVAHSLRGIYINFSRSKGVPLEVIAQNVGHDSVNTTGQWYVRNTEEELLAGAMKAAEAFAAVRNAGAGGG